MTTPSLVNHGVQLEVNLVEAASEVDDQGFPIGPGHDAAQASNHDNGRAAVSPPDAGSGIRISARQVRRQALVRREQARQCTLEQQPPVADTVSLDLDFRPLRSRPDQSRYLAYLFDSRAT